MIVPLTLKDFLERADFVYGQRIGVVDEPSPPGGGLGRITYSRFAAMARGMAARLDEQHLDFRISRQPVREHAARRARADDDVIEFQSGT